KHPGFTTAAVLCLALGIGTTTGVFSVVNSVLLRPLPYKNPHQLVRIYSEFPGFPNGGLRRFALSQPEYLDLKRETRSWEAIEGWETAGANLATKNEPTRTTAAFVTGGLLNALVVGPAFGRLLTAAAYLPAASLLAN